MNADLTWLGTADAGWAPVDMPAEVMEDSFVSGDRSGRRLTLRYYTDDDGSMMAKVLVGAGAQGPPGHAHGGSMAALLDETMGGAAWMSGYMVVAAELNVTFKKMLPLGTRCLVRSRVSNATGRKVRTEGVVTDERGTVYSTATGLFITLDREAFGDLSGKVFPRVWRTEEATS
ncbi:MAG: PaaI family thioesterase [Actinobacteria bacterium]|nr:PaaI family thioesterase [Actinomycetota bacterium]